MKNYRLNDMTRGWFVGDFSPTSFKTSSCEVGLKNYRAGDYEDSHYHNIATELTLIVSGEVMMNGLRYSTGDIIVIEPGERTDFEAITDTINVVVKVPGVFNDKFE